LSAKKRKYSQQNETTVEPAVDSAALTLLLSRTRNLLGFYREIGLPGFPVTSGLRNFIAGEPPVVNEPQVPEKRPAARPAPAAKPSAESISRQLQSITRELADCRICGSAPGTVVSGRGNLAPRLFVIGDCCRDGDDTTLWSAESDELFWKMMAAINLDRDSIYITNCIKCSRGQALAQERESGRNCFSYLERELAAIEPGLICTMGEIAAGLLLGGKAPLARMRGKFHTYRYPHGGTARVMPTYHPSLLLEHPELKRVAWLDLQALQRRLQKD
jgi:DNA polymerase